MQQVKPTQKWQQNIMPIPISGMLPVRRPLNPPFVITVMDVVAEYLITQGFAEYCTHKGEATKSQQVKLKQGGEEKVQSLPKQSPTSDDDPTNRATTEGEKQTDASHPPNPEGNDDAMNRATAEDVQPASPAPRATEETGDDTESSTSLSESQDRHLSPEELVLGYIKTASSEDIASLKSFDKAKAEELLNIEDLTWEKVNEQLSTRQINSLLKKVSSNEKRSQIKT